MTVRSLDEEFAHEPVISFRDSQLGYGRARFVLSRSKPEICSHGATLREPHRITDRGYEAESSDWSNPGDRLQRLGYEEPSLAHHLHLLVKATNLLRLHLDQVEHRKKRQAKLA